MYLVILYNDFHDIVLQKYLLVIQDFSIVYNHIKYVLQKDIMKQFSEKKKTVKQEMLDQFNTSDPIYQASYKLFVLKYPGDATLDETDYGKVNLSRYKWPSIYKS